MRQVLAASALPESVVLGEQVTAAETTGGVAGFAIGGRLATLLDVDALLTPVNIGRGGS